jgi:hypothetical protein
MTVILQISERNWLIGVVDGDEPCAAIGAQLV